MSHAIRITEIKKQLLSEVERRPAGLPFIGKDILEALSISMYVDPLVLYREYIQNATDSIDESVKSGLLGTVADGKITIHISHNDQSVTFKDNGMGVCKKDFERYMTSFGASPKRGSQARGFRGIGRFAGLAYCQNLVFRSKAKNESLISEIIWDGSKIRKVLADNEKSIDLNELVTEVATVTTYKTKNIHDHFFEVSLQKVARSNSDILLNETKVKQYIAQTCPVPYSPDFKFKGEIEDFMYANGVQPGYNILFSSEFEEVSSIFRPYQNNFSVFKTSTDCIQAIDKFRLQSVHDGISAIGWVYQHGYKGVIPSSENIRGIRVRKGNIQVGGDSILTESFPEARFNSWCIGEIHLLDPKVRPNGRRDNFENNIFWIEIKNQFAPYARNITKECRKKSAERNAIKAFNVLAEKADQKISIIKQRALSQSKLKIEQSNLVDILEFMQAKAKSRSLSKASKAKLMRKCNKLDEQYSEIVSHENVEKNSLDCLPKSKQDVLQQVFDLIYEHSSNKIAAKSLLDKIINAYQIMH